MSFCGDCGTKADPGDTFCGSCGAALNEGATAGTTVEAVVARPAVSSEGAALPEATGAAKAINFLAVARDGRFAVADSSGRVELREADGRLIRGVGLPEAAAGLTFSPDGERLIAPCGSRLYEFGVPALAELRSVVYLESTSSTAFAVARADGRLIRLTSIGGMPVTELATGQTVDVYAPPFAPTLLAAGGEGPVLVGNDDGRLAVIDPVRGRPTGTLVLEGLMITGLTVCPGNRVGLAAASDARIRVIDGTTAQVLQTLEGHTCNVFGLASRGPWYFSGGGNGMLTEADLYGEPYENSLRAWDSSTGRQVWSHDTGRAVAMCVAPSADGRRLIAGLSDGTVRVVDLPSSVWV